MIDFKRQILLVFFLFPFVIACRSLPTGTNTATPILANGSSSQPGGIYLSVQESNLRTLSSVVNATTSDILLLDSAGYRADEMAFRLYQKTDVGWKHLQPILDYMVMPLAAEPGLVITAESKITVDTTSYIGAYEPYLGGPLTGTFMIRVHYRNMDSDVESVQYSNEFSIGSQETISQTGVELSLLPSDPLQFTLHNNSVTPIWFVDVRTDRYISYGTDGYINIGADDGLLSLQRLTREGTWQIVHGTTDRTIEPTLISSGQSMSIDGQQWFREKLKTLGSGIYRWDVVIYLGYDVAHNDPLLRDVRHIFSQTFEYSQ